MLNEFQRRVELYAGWDYRLAAHTRFFAAAAMTNSVLAQLCIHGGRWVGVSGSTLGFLDQLGRMLESINLRWAARIECARTPGGHLDAALVSMEQWVVERQLHYLAGRDEVAHVRLLLEMDRVLNWVPRSPPAVTLTLGVRAYCGVLRVVAAQLGRSMRFASRGDRVRIGLGLIDYAIAGRVFEAGMTPTDMSRSAADRLRAAATHSPVSPA